MQSLLNYFFMHFIHLWPDTKTAHFQINCKSCFKLSQSFKNPVSVHFTFSNKMPARGSYRKMSETDRARALGCGNPGSSGSISNEPPDFYQDQTALQANRLFKDRPPSGRPRVTTRAQDRYINNIVARFAPASETHRRLYAARVRNLGQYQFRLCKTTFMPVVSSLGCPERSQN